MTEIYVKKSNLFDYDYIVYPISYINPLLNKARLNKQLQNHINKPCTILFDLLLCNGDCFNRFCTYKFNGNCIDNKSLEIININDINTIKIIEEFYKSNPKMLTKGVLVPQEYLIHIN